MGRRFGLPFLELLRQAPAILAALVVVLLTQPDCGSYCATPVHCALLMHTHMQHCAVAGCNSDSRYVFCLNVWGATFAPEFAGNFVKNPNLQPVDITEVL